MLEALERWPDRVSSALSRVEVERAPWRAGASRAVRTRAENVFATLTLIRLDEVVLANASAFKAPTLRTGDAIHFAWSYSITALAIHLATALTMGDYPEAFITYDERQTRAARAQRLMVLHPGA